MRALCAAALIVTGFTAVSAGLLAPAAAQERAPAPPDATVWLDFQDADLTDVIKLIAELTGTNFLYDDRVRGRVTVVSPTAITVEEAYRVFESILQVKGFTTVEGPAGMLRVVPLREAKESPIETLPALRGVPNRDLFITRLIPLQYIKAETIANTLRPLVSKDANMVAYAPTNTIILTDSASNVRRLLTLIAQIDVATYQEQIKVIPIEFADASTLATQLADIFGGQARGAARRPAARTPRARPRQTTPAAAAAAVFGEAGEPRFITDERTNSIIVIAPQASIERVERLVALLDYKRKGSGRIHVYRLQNADAEELAQTLAALTSGARPVAGARGAAPAPAAGAVAQLEEGVTITADAPTNSLIIQASSEGFAALRDVIEALDLRRPQVMVEALIMEVNVDDDQTLGSGFLYQNPFGDAGRIVFGQGTGDPLTGSPASVLSGGLRTAILGEFVTLIDPNDPSNPIQVPVIQGILRATAKDADTNIISAPVILTADNEEATIVIGQNIPVPTGRVEAATGVATSLSTSSTIERQDVGVTLRVTPQISEGDSVRLQIFQELSEVVAIPVGGSPDPNGPTTTQRTIENTVFVKDGESVMIGGIITETATETVTKVPFLGDIPILGWAFKSKTDDIRKVNLLVILTPHIVRDPDDLQRLTVERREEFKSSAGEALLRTEEQEEARRRALRAGLDLPYDENPVRRELETHQRRYPVEQLPELREQKRERERERLRQMEEVRERAGGAYVVQVSVFREADTAVALLERLIGEGYDGTLLSRRESAGELYHFVQLGPYATETRAQQVAREVGVSTGLATTVLLEP